MDHQRPTWEQGYPRSNWATVTNAGAWIVKKYVKAAIEIVRGLLAEDGRELKTSKPKHEGPMPINYEPELDAAPHCDEEHASRYRQIIGILRWAIELGQFDILTEVALLSQYQASPREGHLEALYWIIN